MATVAVNRAATARDQELVLRFFRVALDVRRATEAALIAHGLTGPQFGALLHLRLVGAISMRDLAESLGCDASNLTGIADRLAPGPDGASCGLSGSSDQEPRADR